MKNSSEYTGGSESEPLQPDQPSEFYHLQMGMIGIQRNMYDHTFDPSSESSDDLKDRLLAFADDIDRLAVQLEAVPGDSTEESVVKDTFRILTNYAAAIRIYGGEKSDLDDARYTEVIKALLPANEIAEALIHLLGMSRGDSLRVEASFIKKDGLFGGDKAKEFSANTLIAELERIPTQFPHLFRVDSTRFMFKKEEQSILVNFCEDIKHAIETIAESFNSDASRVHLQQVLLLIASKFCALLRVLGRDLRLSSTKIFTPTIRQFAQKNDIHYKDVSLDQYSPAGALQDSLNILKLMQRIADRYTRT